MSKWDGVGMGNLGADNWKAKRSFYKPEGIGRGPGLAVARAAMYKPQIPQALRDRMAAYDANPDPNARPHGWQRIEENERRNAEARYWHAKVQATYAGWRHSKHLVDDAVCWLRQALKDFNEWYQAL
jgi:hypothetical protein